MKMNKNDMLGALKAVTIDNGPKNEPIYKKDDVLKKLGDFMPKADGKGKVLDNVREKLNTDLAEPDKEVKFESEWKPAKTDIRDISRKFVNQNSILENSKPNAFRLDLRSLVLDKTHAKFSLRRGGEVAKVDLMFPNANGKITVKISVEGVEDNIYELSLEDEAYVGDFGASILAQIDEMVKEKDSMGLGDYDDPYYIGNKSGGMSDMAPNWVAGGDTGGVGTIADSDMRKMGDLMSLVEADDEDEEDLDLGDLEAEMDAGIEGGEEGEDAGDVNAGGEFGADDFSLDGGDDFGGDFGGGDFGGGDLGGGDDFGGEDVNADDEGGIGVEPDETYMMFRDKTDWLNSSLDTMQKLVATNVADQMSKGEGVILTQDEILNGSVGIKNDSNAEIIDKFLKVYPSLDGIEFTEENLNRIEEKLSLDDGQFDSWLQNELPGMRGDEDVNDALNNEMFDEFEPMGGEEKVADDGLGDFDEFLDSTDGMMDIEGEGEADLDIDAELPDEDETDDDVEIEAELEVGGKELDEFPNT